MIFCRALLAVNLNSPVDNSIVSNGTVPSHAHTAYIPIIFENGKLEGGMSGAVLGDLSLLPVPGLFHNEWYLVFIQRRPP